MVPKLLAKAFRLLVQALSQVLPVEPSVVLLVALSLVRLALLPGLALASPLVVWLRLLLVSQPVSLRGRLALPLVPGLKPFRRPMPQSSGKRGRRRLVRLWLRAASMLLWNRSCQPRSSANCLALRETLWLGPLDNA